MIVYALGWLKFLEIVMDWIVGDGHGKNDAGKSA